VFLHKNLLVTNWFPFPEKSSFWKENEILSRLLDENILKMSQQIQQRTTTILFALNKTILAGYRYVKKKYYFLVKCFKQ